TREVVLGAVPAPALVRSGESPFGVRGSVPLELAAAIGARWWIGPWPEMPRAAAAGSGGLTLTSSGGPKPTGLDSDALISAADRLGIAVISRTQEGGADGADMVEARDVMRHFIRRMGGWQLGASGDPSGYPAALKRFWGASKSVHKDATTLMA